MFTLAYRDHFFQVVFHSFREITTNWLVPWPISNLCYSTCLHILLLSYTPNFYGSFFKLDFRTLIGHTCAELCHTTSLFLLPPRRTVAARRGTNEVAIVGSNIFLTSSLTQSTSQRPRHGLDLHQRRKPTDK